MEIGDGRFHVWITGCGGWGPRDSVAFWRDWYSPANETTLIALEGDHELISAGPLAVNSGHYRRRRRFDGERQREP